MRAYGRNMGLMDRYCLSWPLLAVAGVTVARLGGRVLVRWHPDALAVRMMHWPMGRFGTLAEAAAAIAFLASDDSGFITAAALPLDGGITESFTVPESPPADR